jgi:hypothetical protein
MKLKDIDLCVFISSKDRYGRFDDYKITINQLIELGGDKLFKNKFLSLKVFQNDIENIKNIIVFFSKLGFEITIIEDNKNITTNDRYSNRQKFISSISKDISEFFLRNQAKFSEYVFLVEDDSPIIIKNNTLEYYLNKSVENLDNDKNLEGIHFLRLSHNEIPVSPEEWFIRHQIEIPDLSNEIYTGKYWYNFQPRVNRSLDVLHVSQIIKSEWENYFQFLHPEDAFDKAFQIYNPYIKNYAFSPNYTYSIHLGGNPLEHKETLNAEPEIINLYKELNINI